jgi:tetratricopeptide (TPR) repeat protein
LKVKLTREEQARFKNAPTNNLEAYDYFLRGMEQYWRFTKDSHERARHLFERATELDPMYATAYAESGWTYATSWFAQWSQSSQAFDKAIELTQKALALDESSPSAHMLLGWTSLFRKQHEQAIAEMERAIALDPNLALAYARLGFILNFVGRPQEALGFIEQSLRLDPTYPFFALTALGQAYRLLGRYEEAITAFKRALSLNPNFWPARVQLTICYSELGQEKEARAQAAEVLRVSPNFLLEVLRQQSPAADPMETERIISALRKAGLK